MKNKTVVTGGAGFIGSHLVKRLVDENRKVLIIDDFSRGCYENLTDLGIKSDNVQIHQFDLRNGEGLPYILNGANTVFHLAARIGSVNYLHGNNLAELMAFQDNARIDANVFSACMKTKVKKIVYTSSVSVYPMSSQNGYDAFFREEDARMVDPDGGYGWAKVFGEYQLNLMKNVRTSIARIFSTYGPCMAIDETAQAIPALMKKVIKYPNEDFLVWGDGKATRDFVYISDCINALMLLEMKAAFHPLTVNIGSGIPTSISSLARMIIHTSGKNVLRVNYDKTKPTGTVSRTANIERLSNLGWKQKIHLAKGLKLTYEWIKRKIS